MNLKKNLYLNVFRDSPDPQTLKNPSKYLLKNCMSMSYFGLYINHRVISQYISIILFIFIPDMFYYLLYSN